MKEKKQAGLPKGSKVLFITPFLPFPDDMGQRKRVKFFLESLREINCKITLLHFSAEIPHLWCEHGGFKDQTKYLADEIITYFPRKNIWASPVGGETHRLDEWIDEDLLLMVERICLNKYFDFVVINNVWMSKIFDSVPKWIVRINDTHDVFYVRRNAYKKINNSPDFFICDRESEAFGWKRADINIAITAEERLLIKSGAPNVEAIHLPYIESMSPPSRAEYLSSNKVSFGFIGSGHAFNVKGIKDLIKAFKTYARWSPIELIIAGSVCKSLTSEETSLVRSVGYVSQVEEFYDQVDVVVSPLDFGSGLKIKVIEAISLGIPIIATKHSASGSDLIGNLVVDNVESLAKVMADIGVTRPPMTSLSSLVALTQRSLLLRVKRQLELLSNQIAGRLIYVILKLSGLKKPTNSIEFKIAIGIVREFSYQGQVVIHWEDNKAPYWIDMMPPSVRLSGINELGYDEGRSRVDLESLFSSAVNISVYTDDISYIVKKERCFCVYDSRFSEDHSRKRDAHFNVDCSSIFNYYPNNIINIPVFSRSQTWDPIIERKEEGSRGEVVLVVVKSLTVNENGPCDFPNLFPEVTFSKIIEAGVSSSRELIQSANLFFDDSQRYVFCFQQPVDDFYAKALLDLILIYQQNVLIAFYESGFGWKLKFSSINEDSYRWADFVRVVRMLAVENKGD